MYYIQSRWKLENRKLHYYGLRNAPNMFKNDIAVSKKQAKILASLPRELNPKELSVLEKLIGKQVVHVKCGGKTRISENDSHAIYIEIVFTCIEDVPQLLCCAGGKEINGVCNR